jgi:multicomponent K+:H+ antiporter subunit D
LSHFIIFPILLPLLTGVLLILLSGHRLILARAVSLISVSLLFFVSAQLLNMAISGDIQVYALGNWAPPFGITLVLDRLSTLMLLVTSVLAFFSLVYSIGNRDQFDHNFHALVHFLLLGVNGAFLTGDLFNLFVFFEILLLASYALLLHGGGAARARSGLHYVVLNLAGSALFLIAVAALYGLTGTLNMADMAIKVAALEPGSTPLVATAAILLFLVFGLKAAIVPLYFWLPRAYAAASAPVAALFAVMTKVGVYAIIRIYTLIFGDSAGALAHLIQSWLWPISLITLVLGALGVMAARNLRIQVAYLVIVSVGTLLAGVALNSEAAISATLYYLLHSTWICGALFLLSDVIKQQRGASVDHIIAGPALPQAVLVGSLFFVAAASVIGMPPLSGFIGKIMLLNSAATDTEAAWLWGIVLGSSLAVLMALSRSGSTFFWRTEDPVTDTARASGWALAAIIGLLSMSILLSGFGASVMQYTNALAHQVLTPGLYIDAVQTHQIVTERDHE